MSLASYLFVEVTQKLVKMYSAVQYLHTFPDLRYVSITFTPPPHRAPKSNDNLYLCFINCTMGGTGEVITPTAMLSLRVFLPHLLP